MMLSFSSVFVVLLCAFITADAAYNKVVTGYTANSVVFDVDPGTLQNGDEYGIKVDMWNGVAAVTAVGRALDAYMEVVTSGAVYVFSTSNHYNWKYTGTALRSGYTEDGFGLGLSVGDSILAVGAPYDSRWGADNGGCVYVYAGTAPTYTISTIFAEHTERDTYFGTTVAIIRSGTSGFKNGAVVVGAPGHSHEGHKQVGAVFVYAKNYGSSFYKMNMMLEPSEMKENAQLGYSMAVYGNTLVVGAPGANAAYLFELLLHVEECPHGGHGEELPPDACQQDHHRALQGEGGDNHDNHEQQEREQQEREHENHQVYYQWKYDQILAIHLEDEQSYKDSMFGASVAVYNETVLTVVVGAPDMTAPTTGYTYAGAVYVLTVMQKSHIWPNFVPDGYHEEGNEPHHLRKLQGGEGGDHHEDDHHHVKWDPSQSTVGWDCMGNFWLREAVLYGDTGLGQFGSAVAADYNNLFVGSNNDHPLGYGSAKVYERTATNVQDYDRPVISGPLFKKVYTRTGTLSDSAGNKGDKFGSSISLYKNQVLVGAYLKGLTSATTVGTGGAYMFNRIKHVLITPSPTPRPTRMPIAVVETVASPSWPYLGEGGHINTAAALQIAGMATLLLLASVLGAYRVYKYRGGKTEASVVLGASWKSVQEFGTTVANKVNAKLPFGGRSKNSHVSLSDMSLDDSTSSQTPMNHHMNSSHGSSSSSSSSISSSSGASSNSGSSSRSGPPGGRFQPQQRQQQGGAPGPRGGFRPQQPPGQPMSQPRQPSYPQQGQGQGQGQYQHRPGPGPGPGRSSQPRPGSQHQLPQRTAPYGAGAGTRGSGGPSTGGL